MYPHGKEPEPEISTEAHLRQLLTASAKVLQGISEYNARAAAGQPAHPMRGAAIDRLAGRVAAAQQHLLQAGVTPPPPVVQAAALVRPNPYPWFIAADGVVTPLGHWRLLCCALLVVLWTCLIPWALLAAPVQGLAAALLVLAIVAGVALGELLHECDVEVNGPQPLLPPEAPEGKLGK